MCSGLLTLSLLLKHSRYPRGCGASFRHMSFFNVEKCEVYTCKSLLSRRQPKEWLSSDHSPETPRSELSHGISSCRSVTVLCGHPTDWLGVQDQTFSLLRRALLHSTDSESRDTHATHAPNKSLGVSLGLLLYYSQVPWLTLVLAWSCSSVPSGSTILCFYSREV